MDERRRLVVVAVGTLVLLGAVAAVGTVMDGSEGSAGADGDVPTASGTPYSLSDGGGGDGGTTTPPFDMRIESIESCGQTCRDVTATLVNNQERQATGVTVYTRIYAGEDTEGDVVWEGTQDVGALGAGATETDTKRVELGYMDAMAVQSEDGRITIQLTVETDRRTVTFVEHRDVS